MVQLTHIMPVSLMDLFDVNRRLHFVEAAWLIYKPYRDAVLRTISGSGKVIIDNSTHLLQQPLILDYLEDLITDLIKEAVDRKRNVQHWQIVVPDVKNEAARTRTLFEQTFPILYDCLNTLSKKLKKKKEKIWFSFIFPVQAAELAEAQSFTKDLLKYVSTMQVPMSLVTLGIPYQVYPYKDPLDRVKLRQELVYWIWKELKWNTFHLLGLNAAQELLQYQAETFSMNLTCDTSLAIKAACSNVKLIPKNGNHARFPIQIEPWTMVLEDVVSLFWRNVWILNMLAAGQHE